MVDNDAFDDDVSLDPQLLRAAQLDALREEYARLWRAAADLDRIHEVERLLERLLSSLSPIELPSWFVLGSNGPPPRWALRGEQQPPRIIRIYREIHTCVNLIDPILKMRGWANSLVQREETFVDYRDKKTKRVDYALRLPRGNGRLLLVALIEAKHQGLKPHHGLEQVKRYASGRRERIGFVFSTNGHHYVEFDCRLKVQSGPFPLDLFPTPDELIERLRSAGMDT